MKSFKLIVTHYYPKTGNTEEREIGPVFGVKTVNQLTIELLRKRNIISVRSEETPYTVLSNPEN